MGGCNSIQSTGSRCRLTILPLTTGRRTQPGRAINGLKLGRLATLTSQPGGLISTVTTLASDRRSILEAVCVPVDVQVDSLYTRGVVLTERRVATRVRGYHQNDQVKGDGIAVYPFVQWNGCCLKCLLYGKAQQHCPPWFLHHVALAEPLPFGYQPGSEIPTCMGSIPLMLVNGKKWDTCLCVTR